MIKRLILRFFTLFSLVSGVCVAQQSRSLEVNIQLAPPSDQTLLLEVSVRNHAFILVPPTFAIIRPITSLVTQTLQIEPGQSAASITLQGISTDAVDYTVRFRCLNCSDSIPLQFLISPRASSGTSRGLIDDAYIDPEDLEPAINVELDTLGFIRGVVRLAQGQAAENDVRLTVRAVDAVSGQLASSQPIRIVAGDNIAEYRLNGLARRENSSYIVEVSCGNCRPVRQVFEQSLDSMSNHSAINFQVEEGTVPISGIINLLFSE